MTQVVKNVELIKKFKFPINKHANALKTNITKLNFICDALYHILFFTSFIMGVNLTSNWLPCAQSRQTWVGCHVHNVNLSLSWLPCAQCELELELVAMCIEHRLSKCLSTREISQWQTNVFYVVWLINFQGGKKCNILHT